MDNKQQNGGDKTNKRSIRYKIKVRLGMIL